MRLFYSYAVIGRLAKLFILSFLALLIAAKPLHAKADEELLSIIKTSCQKSCIGGRGDEAFCTSYCQCVGGEIEKRSQSTEISKILKTTEQQDEVVRICSGETALGFFDKTCRAKCAGVPRCDAYCGCLAGKIKNGRKIEEVGAFFIQLGKNDTGAVERLKRLETSCTQ